MLQRRIRLVVFSTMLLLAPALNAQVSQADTIFPRTEAGLADDQVALRPGDVVRITIWREEDLSGEFLVGTDGVVVLPLLGRKRVTDVPLPQLRDTLLQEYQIQLRNPAIEITPLRRINVLGEVNKPGLYEVDPTITLAAAVALAGGATQSGDLNKISVLRGERVIRERVGAQASLSTVDVRSGDQIFVEPKSWFSRNSTFLVSAALAVPGVIATVFALTR